MRYAGINNVILDSLSVEKKVEKHIANAYRLVFHGQTSLLDAILQINTQVPDSKEIRKIVDFLEASENGIISKI